MCNYQPCIPIPEALLQKMRDRYVKIAAQPIAKVTKALACKNQRAKAKLAVAFKKVKAVAAACANGCDATMSEAPKQRAIIKAMRRSGDNVR